MKLLASIHRQAADAEIIRHCAHRSWHLWIGNARSTHVHVVVTANGYAGDVVRDQLKANATRAVRNVDPSFRDRPVWTRGGDWECINDEDDLEQVIEYVRNAQDRKYLDQNE